MNETDTDLPCVDPFSIFMYNYSPEQKFMISQRYANNTKQNVMRTLAASGIAFQGFKHQKFKVSPNSFLKVRLGYLSWDFADHPLAHLLASIFEFHDRSKF